MRTIKTDWTVVPKRTSGGLSCFFHPSAMATLLPSLESEDESRNIEILESDAEEDDAQVDDAFEFGGILVGTSFGIGPRAASIILAPTNEYDLL